MLWNLLKIYFCLLQTCKEKIKTLSKLKMIDRYVYIRSKEIFLYTRKKGGVFDINCFVCCQMHLICMMVVACATKLQEIFSWQKYELSRRQMEKDQYKYNMERLLPCFVFLFRLFLYSSMANFYILLYTWRCLIESLPSIIIIINCPLWYLESYLRNQDIYIHLLQIKTISFLHKFMIFLQDNLIFCNFNHSFIGSD